MCGFVGFIDPKQKITNPQTVLREASARIARRGPDGEAFWNEGPVHMAHRRLAIRDLSAAGTQPMTSANGRFVLVFNGEIYNCDSLRGAPALRDVAWRGTSDTEILLEHTVAYGLAATLEASRGMFAVALWDKQLKTLTLARDRMGEKPLYLGYTAGALVFSSELKVLRAFPGRPELNQDALALYLRYGYIPAPYTAFERFQKLMPGTTVSLTLEDITQQRFKEPVPFWTLDQAALAGDGQYGRLTFKEKADKLDALLQQSVGEQLVADVPVGAFLSGGIDSSLVVAVAQRLSPSPVKTFTIGFHDPAFDEAPYARKIAEHLHTEHHETYIGEDDVRGLVEDVAQVYDEPFADASSLPTLLVSRIVRKQVTVCLSGDAGDELFRGYDRYTRGRKLWHAINKVPPVLRTAAATLLTSVRPQTLDKFLGPAKLRGITGDKLHKAAALLRMQDSQTFYHGLSELAGGAQLLGPAYRDMVLGVTQLSDEAFSDYASRWDCRFYLPDDILVKVDRAAMHASLETRVPLLRPEIVELSWGLRESQHIAGSKGKQLMRSVLSRYVPAELFERPKRGFGVPMDKWLRGPLKTYAEDCLKKASASVAALDHARLDAMWAEHQSESRNWSYALWGVVALGAWLREAGY
ncbi:asparagine synthase (glutamine-hydrolyzing) [Paraburkholderia sp. UCT31]|uniref:asparagine synthase (glutamine-hydrolyzing) n=1 Tax=Paraburkholderia sp. UCT31 TaxID=2615209 RepID=UPI0016555550|nr:asparagine synthase (glutamine-hydrolyzing) [Paraburkholderia sp. UCT31]MBC8737349.1 asparagine synthase (glutamine-hydrolyzing) [Paraburkholderia sp. UCT31]